MSDSIPATREPSPDSPWRFCVAPMLDWTDRHYRYLARQLSRHARLYTEMVTTGALLHGDVERHLRFDESEHPVALQLGGSDPNALAEAARIGADWGYDEINLNVGCPSDRVQNGAFGACLMAEPGLVAECVAAMRAAVDVPVTVKSRIGIDHQETYEEFREIVDIVADQGGANVFLVHSRKAWLKGLSPKQNRDVPPLRPEFATRLKRERPDLTVVLNGGLTTVASMQAGLGEVDGVMVGRAAYQNVGLLAEIDAALFDGNQPTDRLAALQAYRDYAAAELARGTRLSTLIKPILTLFQGRPGARAYRRHLSEQAPRRPGDASVIDEAIDLLR
ncbi:tRNA dihydrouridine(20/20a) synthase DusA [Guyparkeria sp. SB14A]|uniref:tRNA dihydrouridine(20/20a) synthase DusA n=1 Tax=Guyparkeria sp. SB14A TaxID=2571147 RepID=UPI0010AC06AC|nr:tRNA dihydrouridine(20/20a) synthase DusA [Guyparkeria sp. SB14A]TKA90543.1 tRNA dihydrouridine(20/20a) synthase DusA [Guyparkeria sp. SB14A]